MVPLPPDPQQNPMLPPGMPPLPPPSPALGFQVWASDPRNAHKVQSSMVAPDAPLQPNSGQPAQMASVNPPQIAPQPNAMTPPAGTSPTQTSNAMTPPGLFGSAPPSVRLDPSSPNPTLITPSVGKGFPGMISPGNVDLSNRPSVANPKGGYSSVYSSSFGTDKGETLVPLVTDGEDGQPPHILSPSEGPAYYAKYGKSLGTFGSPDAADAYAQQLHLDQSKMVPSGDRIYGNNPSLAGNKSPMIPPRGISSTPPPTMTMPDGPMAKLNPMTPPNVQSPLSTDTAELKRLQSTGSGVSQVKNPWLKGLGMVGDFAASALLGKGAAMIPGTTAHNQWLQGQKAGQVNQDREAIAGLLTGQQNAANLAHTQAETSSLGANDAIKAQNSQTTLAKSGLKVVMDENGKPNIVPDEDSPVFQKQQMEQGLIKAHTDSFNAGIELKKAQTAFEQAKNNPNSPIFRQAQSRLETAQRNASTAQQRLDLSTKTFLMRSQGVDENGNAYSGAMLDDNDNPIGTSFQQNVRPTGTERNKADMAGSAKEQLGTITSILQKRPDVFGPVAGRTTDFNVWLGSQDPDAQRFRAARTIAGDHLAGTFGGRSEAALSAIDNAIGQFKDNPAAALAGVDQLSKANDRFLSAGTVRTAGSKAGGNNITPPTQRGASVPPTGSQALTDGGITYHIPAAQVAAFKKDHPNAR